MAYRSEACEICAAPGHGGFGESDCHLHGISGDSDGRVDQHCVGPHLKSLGSMGGRSETGVDNDGHTALGDDYLKKLAGFQAFVGSDRSTERHNSGRANLFEAFAEHRIGLNIRKHMESEAGKLFRSFQGLDGIGKQIFRIGMYFKLDEVGAEYIAGNS